MSPKQQPESLGDLIYRVRQEKNVSQVQLARMLNTTQQTVSRWESGVHTPDNDQIESLAVFLGISAVDLIDGYLVPAKYGDVTPRTIRTGRRETRMKNQGELLREVQNELAALKVRVERLERKLRSPRN